METGRKNHMRLEWHEQLSVSLDRLQIWLEQRQSGCPIIITSTKASCFIFQHLTLCPFVFFPAWDPSLKLFLTYHWGSQSKFSIYQFPHDLRVSTVTWKCSLWHRNVYCNLAASTITREWPAWPGTIYCNMAYPLWYENIHYDKGMPFVTLECPTVTHCDLEVSAVIWGGGLHSDPDSAQGDLRMLTVMWTCSLSPKNDFCLLEEFTMTWECSQCYSPLWPNHALCFLRVTTVTCGWTLWSKSTLCDLRVTTEIWDGHSSGQKCSEMLQRTV